LPSERPLLTHERVVAREGDPDRWMAVLHGIYGAGRNWGSVARRVVAERPEWGALLVDLRQHGGSMGFPPPHTLAAASDDLSTLFRAEALAVPALLGHSFGGKVALAHARDAGPSLRQLWIVDSTPEARPPAGSAWEMLRVLRSLPESFAERGEGALALERAGLAHPTAQWMATNLVADRQGSYRWRIDPDEMEALLRDFFATDLWDVVEDPPGELVLHFVKAEESSVLGEAVCTRIERAGKDGRVHLHRVAGGHWLNADNPGALVSLLVENL